MKIAVIVLSVLALALLLGAAIAASRSSGHPPFREGTRGDTYIARGELTAIGGQAADSELSIFRVASETTPSADVRRALAGAHDHIDSAGFEIGAIDWSRLRAVLAQDTASTQINLVPTGNGWVCYGLGHKSARCVPSLASGISWTMTDLPNVDGSVTSSVYGIAADGVSRIIVVLDGSRLSADISDNAFLVVRRGSHPIEVVAMEVEWKDGRRDVVFP